MNIVEKNLYNVFRKELNLTDESAASFLEAVKDILEFESNQADSSIASKEDINRLELESQNTRQDIRRLELELQNTREDIRKLEINTREDIHKLELKLEIKISETKSDIYKAIFFTGLIQFLAIIGGVIAIVKFMMK